MQFGQMQILAYTDMHNEILQMTNLYLTVRYFITAVSNLQFYISDLVTPGAYRYREESVQIQLPENGGHLTLFSF